MAFPMSREELPDYLRPGLDLILVGINPGLRSAELGHHFAGRNNRFWQLLHESGLTPRRLTYDQDASLPDLGIGITNVAARPTRSSSDLKKEDFDRGRRSLARKIARFRPAYVGFVGLTAYREFQGGRGRVHCGFQENPIEGAEVFVLPNPSGRNAHYSYAEMLRSWRELARSLKRDA